jgi:membrane protease YdiL (CAAX protease family)
MEKAMSRAEASPAIGKGRAVLLVAFAPLLFSLFRKADTLVRMGNILVEWTSSGGLVFSAIALVRLVLAGLVVLVVLPVVLGFKRLGDWLPGYLRIDRKVLSLGLCSFALFCALAAAISLSMGIFRGDLSVVFARPDLRPDPDVVGWTYFLLALAPGIWEELAFRGLIQSKLRTAFSTTMSILLGSIFFALFHLTNLLTQPASQVMGGVIMAFAFGIAWGVMTVRSRSVIPAMLSHYLVDAIGQVFLGVDGSNPALVTGYFVLLTLTFAICNVLLAKVMYKKPVPIRARRPVSP